MTIELYRAGLSFRQSIRSGQIAPHQYGAVLQDLCADQPGLKPALIDLSARQVFREIPITGTSAQKMLAKDRLLSELRPLYRDAVINQLVAFIDGVLDLDTPHQTVNSQYASATRVPYTADHQIAYHRHHSSFYIDNPKRLLMLSILSCGLYDILWTYRHWRHYKRLATVSPSSLQSRKKDGRIIPFWSAMFSVFYIVGAARRIRLRLGEVGLDSEDIRPWLIFCLYSLLPTIGILFQATESIGVNVLILAFQISVLCMASLQSAYLQRLANQVNQREGVDRLQYRSLNGWDWSFLIAGASIFLLAILGWLVPPSWLGS